MASDEPETESLVSSEFATRATGDDGAEIPAWPDDWYRDASSRIGLAFFPLLFLPECWIHRRVERIEAFSHEMLRRSVTVDLTIPAHIAPDLRLPHSDQFVVPVAFLAKRPLRNFDLRQDNAPVPLLARTQNALIAEELLVWCANWALHDAGINEPLSCELETLLRSAASEDDIPAKVFLDRFVDRANDGDSQAHELVANPDFAFMSTRLSTSYMLTAVINGPLRRSIVKYAYDDLYEFESIRERGGGRRAWQEATGADPIFLDAATPSAQFAASYHCEIIVPEEMRIESALLYDNSRQYELFDVDENVDRASLHVSEVPQDARMQVFLAVRPERQGFPVAALSSAWMLTIVLSAGTAIGLPREGFAGSTTSLILALLAVISGATLRFGESRLVRSALFPARIVIFVATLAAFVAVVAFTATALQDGLVRAIWFVSATVALFSALILSFFFVRAAKLRPRG